MEQDWIELYKVENAHSLNVACLGLLLGINPTTVSCAVCSQIASIMRSSSVENVTYHKSVLHVDWAVLSLIC